jgi:hypothetical protein
MSNESGAAQTEDVSEVILVALSKRLGISGRHLFDLVTKRAMALFSPELIRCRIMLRSN